MYTLNILLPNMTGLNSAVKRTCVLEYLLPKICDCMEEGPVLLLLFPFLSLSPLIGLLKHGVCVCCFVLFVLSGCYVVVCEKKKKMLITKKKIPSQVGMGTETRY